MHNDIGEYLEDSLKVLLQAIGRNEAILVSHIGLHTGRQELQFLIQSVPRKRWRPSHAHNPAGQRSKASLVFRLVKLSASQHAPHADQGKLTVFQVKNMDAISECELDRPGRLEGKRGRFRQFSRMPLRPSLS